MSAIERCRTAALGGHVERCEACAHLRISYNSCRNRHCPKCQAVAAKEWLADRRAELLPVPYFHVVFTLPGPIADIAYQNKAVVYDLLLKTAAETLITIAPTGQSPWAEGPRPQAPRRPHRAHRRTAHLGIGTHPPSARPYHRTRRRLLAQACPGAGRGPALDCLPARLSLCPCGCSHGCSAVCSWSRVFLERLIAAYQAGRLEFFADQAALAEPAVFKTHLGARRKIEWVVYAKPPFWRTRRGPRLPVPLHAPDRYCQQPARRLRRRTRDFQMEGLPGQTRRPLQANGLP